MQIKFRFKYDLAWKTRLQIPFYYLMWKRVKLEDATNGTKRAKETFDLVLNGLTRHDHKFERFDVEAGVFLMRCNHVGCNLGISLNDPITNNLAIRLQSQYLRESELLDCMQRESLYPERVQNFMNDLGECQKIIREIREQIFQKIN